MKKITALFMTIALLLAMSITASAAVNDTGFSDVDADAWYAEAATFCRDHHVMNGTGTTTFSPNSTMTRAMLAVVLYRVAGSPAVTGASPFQDAANGSWCADAVIWANQNHIVSGYGNGLFGANNAVTREQIATILWRYAGSPSAERGIDFADENIIASYASSAVDWARANGVVGGKEENLFDPKGDATRAQVAAILMRYIRNIRSESDPVPSPSGEAKVLVAYFSGTGTTRTVAQNIAAALGSNVATLHEIVPQTPYTAADLDYTNSNCRAVREQNTADARPAISGSVENMEQYDIVFLGYPIWNNDAPRIIYTFLENEEFNGKTIIPFCTSGGSGISGSLSGIQPLAPNSNWLSGQRFSGNASQSVVENWINSLHISQS